MLATTFSLLLRILSNPIGNVFQKKLTEQQNHPLLVNFLTFFHSEYFLHCSGTSTKLGTGFTSKLALRNNCRNIRGDWQWLLSKSFAKRRFINLRSYQFL